MKIFHKKGNKNMVALIALLLIVCVGGVVIFIPDTPTTVLVSSEKILSVSTGEKLYQQHCASCHGKNLEGQPNWRTPIPEGGFPAPPHDETGHTWHHDDETLFNYTKLGGKGIAEQFDYENPNSGMPAYEDILGDNEIISILNYIKSTWPQEIRDIQSARNAK